MTHFERRLWRWAWRMRVRMDRCRGDLLPAPFSPRPQDAETQEYYALSILYLAGESTAKSAIVPVCPQGSDSERSQRRKLPGFPR